MAVSDSPGRRPTLRAPGRSGWLLVGVSGGWLLIQLAKLLLPPLLPAIIDDVGITLALAGVMLTALEATSAFAQLPGGQIADRLNTTLVILVGVGLLMAGLVVFVGVPAYWALVGGAALFGLGRGLFSVSSRVVIYDHFVERRGRALGVFTGAYDVGGILASGVAIVVLATATWRAPFFGVILLFVLFGVLYARTNREPYALEPVGFTFGTTLRRLLVTPGQRNTIITYALFFFTAFGVLSFLPSYLQSKGFSPALASSLYAIYFLVGMTIKPISGGVSDRVPRRLVATVGLTVAAAMLALLVLADSLVAVGPAIFVLALGLKSQFPLVDAILLDGVPDGAAGSDLGAAKMMLYGVGSLGPAYAGVVAGRYDYGVAFSGFALCMLLATVLMEWQRRRG